MSRQEERKCFLDDGHVDFLENQPLEPSERPEEEVQNRPEQRNGRAEMNVDVIPDDSCSDTDKKGDE